MRVGVIPISWTVELRRVPSVAAYLASAAGMECDRARCSEIYPLWPQFSSVVLAIHSFAFECPKEALDRRIVGAAARSTHAADHVMRLQEPLVLLRSKLTAPIRVQNDRKSIFRSDPKMSEDPKLSERPDRTDMPNEPAPRHAQRNRKDVKRHA